MPVKFLEEKPKIRFLEEEPKIRFLEEEPKQEYSAVGRVFTPLSKQITGKSLAERSDLLNRWANHLVNKAYEQGRTPSTAEFFIKQLPAAVAQTGIEVIDPSPFDLFSGGVISAAGKIPVAGTTLARVATKVPIGAGFNKSVKELVRLDETLKNVAKFSARAPGRSTFPSALERTITEATSAMRGERTPLVPSVDRLVPRKPRDLFEALAKDEAEILAAKGGIISRAKIYDEAMKIQPQVRGILDSWTQNFTPDPITMKAVLINIANRMADGIDNMSADAIQEIKNDLIKASAMKSQYGRGLPTTSYLPAFESEIKFLSAQADKLGGEASEQAKNLFKFMKTPGFWDKFQEVRTAGLVSGYLTQVRNVFGNVTARMFRPAEKVLAGGWDILASGLTRRQRTRFMREGGADVVGVVAAFPHAIRNAVKALIDDSFVSDARIMEAVTHKRAIAGWKGNILRLPFRALGAMDEFFTTLSRSASIYSNATREALLESLYKNKEMNVPARIQQLIQNPTLEMIVKMQKDALIDTYRAPLGKGAGAIENAISKNPLLKIVVPFFRTPVNLFKWSFDRAPTGLISPNNWKAIFKGSAEVQADAIAKISLGSLISAGMVFKVLDGSITGRISTDKKVRDEYARMGIMPYSIHLNGKAYSYKGFEPLASWLALIANTTEEVKASKGEFSAKQVTLIAFETAKMIKEQPFLQGLSDMTDALGEPEKYGERFIQNLAGSMVPYSSALRHAKIVSDPVVREPDSIPESIKASLPYFSKGVAPKLDVWGNVITREGTMMERLFSPMGWVTKKPDLVEQELLALGKFPTKIAKRYRGLDLSVQDRNLVTRIEGKLKKAALDRLVILPEYQRATPTEQDQMIDKIFMEITAKVRTPLMNAKFISQYNKLKTLEEKLELLETYTKKVIYRK